jgi:hypothetical protein
MPDKPATKSTAAELDQAEGDLDVDGLVAGAVESTEMRSIDDPVDWQEIPVPFGVSR